MVVMIPPGGPQAVQAKIIVAVAVGFATQLALELTVHEKLSPTTGELSV